MSPQRETGREVDEAVATGAIEGPVRSMRRVTEKYDYKNPCCPDDQDALMAVLSSGFPSAILDVDKPVRAWVVLMASD
jgi:hypothetical protein